MQVQKINVDRDRARELYRQYRTHQNYSTPMDVELQRIYQLIAQGRMVVRAIESVIAAGIYVDGPYAGFPKLAICRADATTCFWRRSHDGGGTFRPHSNWGRANEASSKHVTIPAGSWEFKDRNFHGESQLPPIPLPHRPRRGLANYHLLWEAEWRRTPPVDPMLLRRVGKSDAWLVLAAWDLTDAERAVLSTRLSA